MANENDAQFVPINERNDEQWRVISERLDVSGLRVLDLGCGHGDMLLRAALAGASFVRGVDNDPEIATGTHHRCAERFCIGVICADAVEWLRAASPDCYDVAFCMSLLPYVDAYRVLRLLYRAVQTLVVECQYEGDGPGIVPGRTAMSYLLAAAGWESVERIGYTVVEYRGTERDIWLCERTHSS